MIRLLRCLKLISALAISAVFFTACAPYKLNKALLADPKDVPVLRDRIEGARHYQKALYEVSTAMVDQCEFKTVREPFALMSMGTMVGVLKEDRLGAYWEAGGIDETWRVLWTTGEVLKPGQRVVRIQGKNIENNKSWMGEFPAAIYIEQTVKAREAAEKGKPYVVTLEDGTEVQVPTRPSCRTMGVAVPMVLDLDAFQTPINQYHSMVLPPTAIAEAATQDEYRYLAGLAVYMSASSHAKRRRMASGGVVALGASTLFINPLLYLLINQPGVLLGQAVRNAGMDLDAGLFATGAVHRMGGDPLAGVQLVERLKHKKIRASHVALSEADLKTLGTFALELGRLPRADAALTPVPEPVSRADGVQPSVP